MKLNFSNILNIILALLILGYIANYIYRLPKFKAGENVKNFTATTLSGEILEMQSLREQYVLLDFWGSWCGPCRAENPELKALYNEFKGKKLSDAEGFTIVSVGLETKRQSWINAIEKDGLDWPYHIIEDQKFSGEIALLYGVKKIPTKYLIGPDGKIISVNQSLSEIKAFLAARTIE
ncbi:MAG: TlpA family protein disulfide reductase [Saprospiraceae bacterium]|nr:TlpA family protein disulfide reductase [Saprospiraceae bacterium]